jgi:hypothetical protein
METVELYLLSQVRYISTSLPGHIRTTLWAEQV